MKEIILQLVQEILHILHALLEVQQVHNQVYQEVVIQSLILQWYD